MDNFDLLPDLLIVCILALLRAIPILKFGNDFCYQHPTLLHNYDLTSIDPPQSSLQELEYKYYTMAIQHLPINSSHNYDTTHCNNHRRIHNLGKVRVQVQVQVLFRELLVQVLFQGTFGSGSFSGNFWISGIFRSKSGTFSGIFWYI